MTAPQRTTAAAHGTSGSVLAYTTRDDEHAAVRLAAVQHARDHGCALILYAADAASAWSEPLPNQWGSEGEDKRFGDRLNPKDLEFLGQQPIADQVREAQAGGVEAFGWLPKDHGPRALAEYARTQGAHRVFLPMELETIDEVSSLLAGEPDAEDEVARKGIDVEQVGTSASKD
jgi:hypothetical protein